MLRLRHGVRGRLPQPQPRARRRRRPALAADARRARPLRLHGDRRHARRRRGPRSSRRRASLCGRRPKASATCSRTATGLRAGDRQPCAHDGLARRAALVYCFADASFRASPVHVCLGACDRPDRRGRLGAHRARLRRDGDQARGRRSRSPTCGPAGDALQWLALFTATPMPGFGTASVFGALHRRLRRRAGHGPVPHRDLLRHRRHAAQPRSARR